MGYYNVKTNTIANMASRVFFQLGWFPDKDTMNNGGTLAAAATSFITTDGTKFKAQDIIQIDNEVMLVRSVSANTISVSRGYQDSTAATHVTAAIISISAKLWTPWEVYQHINEGILGLWPDCFNQAINETLDCVVGTRTYTIPAVCLVNNKPTIDLIYVEDVNGDYQLSRNWDIVNGEIVFNDDPVYAGNVRLVYRTQITPFSDTAPADDNTTLGLSDELLPVIVLYATSKCLEGVVSKRIRYTDYAASLNDRASDVMEITTLIKMYAGQYAKAKLANAPTLPSYTKRNKVFHRSGKVF